MSGFLDWWKCPQGHKRAIYRQGKSAGKVVMSYCGACNKMYKIKAGHPPSISAYSRKDGK